MFGDLMAGHLTLLSSGPLIVLLMVTEYRRRRRTIARRQAEQAMVRLVDDLIAGLRSGASLAQAANSAMARSPQGMTSDLHAVGSQLLVVTVDQLTSKGGAAIPALQRLRHTLMGRVNGQRRAEAESAQALASAGLLLLAPAVFVGVVAAVDPEIARFYVSEPVGAACVFCALALAGGGWSWMQAITNSVLREFR